MNHPITKLETGLEALLDQVGTSGSDSHERIKGELTALCRSFAASELRLAAGSDEFTMDASQNRFRYEVARNNLRRTLRVYADELEGK